MQDENEALINEYRLVKFEKQKGSLFYGLFHEEINKVLNGLELQLRAKGINPEKLI